MHKSIPAVPFAPLPRAAAGHLLKLLVLGLRHSQFYCGPGVSALAYPGASPRYLTHIFSKDREVYREGQGLCQRLACPSGTRKTCRFFFKVCFLNFRYFFITCKHVTISDKVNFILFIKK